MSCICHSQPCKCILLVTLCTGHAVLYPAAPSFLHVLHWVLDSCSAVLYAWLGTLHWVWDWTPECTFPGHKQLLANAWPQTTHVHFLVWHQSPHIHTVHYNKNRWQAYKSSATASLHLLLVIASFTDDLFLLIHVSVCSLHSSLLLYEGISSYSGQKSQLASNVLEHIFDCFNHLKRPPFSLMSAYRMASTLNL